MTSTTTVDVIYHVLETILGFDKSQVATLRKKKITTWNSPLNVKNIKRSVDSGFIEVADAEQWVYLLKYRAVHNHDCAGALSMTADNWNDVHIPELVAAYDTLSILLPASASASTSGTKSAPSPSIPGTPPLVPSFFGNSTHPTTGAAKTGSVAVTAKSCTPSDVNHTYFLRDS